MRTSEERAAGPHRRMDAMKRAKARRRYVLACTAAITACLAVTVLLSPAGSRLPARAQNAASGGMTASIFTGTPAPGYFVAAVLAFILGILVTVLCFRLRRHMEPFLHTLLSFKYYKNIKFQHFAQTEYRIWAFQALIK